MRYRVTVTEGRRALSYEVDANTEDEAKQRYMDWLSFRGALVVQSVKVEEGGAV